MIETLADNPARPLKAIKPHRVIFTFVKTPQRFLFSVSDVLPLPAGNTTGCWAGVAGGCAKLCVCRWIEVSVGEGDPGLPSGLQCIGPVYCLHYSPVCRGWIMGPSGVFCP